MSSITRWCELVHNLAAEKGWHERPLMADGQVNVDRIAAMIALMHSELSEALEVLRTARIGCDLEWYEMSGKPEGFVVEMADVVIRIMDTCRALGLDLEGAMELKHRYNMTRPARHGGKAL